MCVELRNKTAGVDLYGLNEMNLPVGSECCLPEGIGFWINIALVPLIFGICVVHLISLYVKFNVQFSKSRPLKLKNIAQFNVGPHARAGV